ncbi:Transcriptional regulator IclR [Kineococcus radiotolerans SRS30216 = ATCC BAA-149]|uniref:Glycerol operon regulatory protein n=1 Tax=Kineococcus radiotolerans (strain ATCC BAA-149 / DSM 14245 / SRS30216) TaxID=266940 RepID=A6WA67_KINRD|nr:Transcriptional regulator IclR [Kineococcus radiotolerans SRS30216 = ATCC BAA-149]
MQSVERAFTVLSLLADHGGQLSLSEVADLSGLPLPTAHRLLKTMASSGHVSRLPDRRYGLGPRLIGLGQKATSLLHLWALPHLTRLVDVVGETANLAVLDGSHVVYVAQVPSRHNMRMFTEVGRRVSPHCTGVGKAMLAALDPEQADRVINSLDFTAQTPHTIVTPDALRSALDGVRQQGYAIDDGEQEIGVRCLAVAFQVGPSIAACSVSGPAARLTDETVRAAAPAVAECAQAVAAAMEKNRADQQG